MVEGGRFFLVNYLPVYAAALFLAGLVWAGAPGPLQAASLSKAADGLSVVDVLAAAAAVTLVAVLLHPLQLALVRLLEGRWPRSLRFLAHWSVRRQVAARRRLADRERLPDDAVLSERQIQAAGQAGTELRMRFPAESLCRPTALGNVMAAVEVRAGEPYGYDAVVAWPRLYPVLGERMRAIVDARRDALDVAAALAVVMAVTTVAAVGLLLGSGWWFLLAAVPLALSVVAYRAAIHAALAYGEAVVTAFDLHRFDLTKALHLALPVDTDTERQTNAWLCDWWRQGAPRLIEYEHDYQEAAATERSSRS
jgi:hypothetical protein